MTPCAVISWAFVAQKVEWVLLALFSWPMRDDKCQVTNGQRDRILLPPLAADESRVE